MRFLRKPKKGVVTNRNYPFTKKKQKEINKILFGRLGIFTVGLKLTNAAFKDLKNAITVSNYYTKQDKNSPTKIKNIVYNRNKDVLDDKVIASNKNLTNKQEAKQYSQQIEEYYKEGKYQNAIYLLNKIINSEFCNYHHYNRLCIIYSRIGDLNNELIVVRKCIGYLLKLEHGESNYLHFYDDCISKLEYGSISYQQYFKDADKNAIIFLNMLTRYYKVQRKCANMHKV